MKIENLILPTRSCEFGIRHISECMMIKEGGEALSKQKRFCLHKAAASELAAVAVAATAGAVERDYGGEMAWKRFRAPSGPLRGRRPWDF